MLQKKNTAGLKWVSNTDMVVKSANKSSKKKKRNIKIFK